MRIGDIKQDRINLLNKVTQKYNISNKVAAIAYVIQTLILNHTLYDRLDDVMKQYVIQLFQIIWQPILLDNLCFGYYNWNNITTINEDLELIFWNILIDFNYDSKINWVVPDKELIHRLNKIIKDEKKNDTKCCNW